MRALLAFGLAFSVIAATPALAAEVDFSTVLMDDTGKTPLKDCDKFEESQPGVQPKCLQFVDVTLGRLAIAALNSPESGLTFEQQTQRGYLARAIRRQPKQNLSGADVTMLSELIIKRGYAPIIVLDAIELLDPVRLKK